MVDVLLKTFALITRRESTTRCSGKQASFNPLGLSVAWPGNILDDDTPLTISIYCTNRAGVKDVTGADVSFIADPVTFFKGTAMIVGIIKVFLRQRRQAID